LEILENTCKSKNIYLTHFAHFSVKQLKLIIGNPDNWFLIWSFLSAVNFGSADNWFSHNVIS